MAGTAGNCLIQPENINASEYLVHQSKTFEFKCENVTSLKPNTLEVIVASDLIFISIKGNLQYFTSNVFTQLNIFFILCLKI